MLGAVSNQSIKIVWSKSAELDAHLYICGKASSAMEIAGSFHTCAQELMVREKCLPKIEAIKDDYREVSFLTRAEQQDLPAAIDQIQDAYIIYLRTAAKTIEIENAPHLPDYTDFMSRYKQRWFVEGLISKIERIVDNAVKATCPTEHTTPASVNKFTL